MFIPTIRAALLGASIAATAAPATAALVTVQFGGEVLRSLVGGVSVGDRIVGYYTFDSHAPDIVADPKIGIYEQSTVAAFRVGSFVFESRFPTAADGVSGGILVFDDQGGWDSFGVNTLDFSLSLMNPSGSAIVSDDLPLTPLNPADFSNTQFYFGQGGRIIGTVDTLVIGPPTLGVPLPSSLSLALAGLLALVALRRR